MVDNLVRPMRNYSGWQSDAAVKTVLVAIRLGVEPIEACRAVGIRAIDLWNAILMQETYVGGTLDLLTQAQRKALVLAVFAGVPGVAAGMMLGDWLLPFVYNQTIAGFDHSVYSWLMFGIVCGIFAQYRSELPDDT